MVTAVRVRQLPETVVSRWVDSFNARDLERMLACLSEDVDFHPVRMSGLGASYRGHDGVREWFARLRRLGHDYRIVLAEARDAGDGRVFASGSLTLGGEADVGPFCALHRIAGGVIVSAHQYHSDPDMIEQLGLIA